MKPIVIKSDIVPKLASFFMPVAAITLWPFIFVKKVYGDDAKLINHESIHIQQQIELLVVGFYIVYLYDWLRGLIKYRDASRAYFRIRFEQEAYRFDDNMSYLNIREKYAWRKYKI